MINFFKGSFGTYTFLKSKQDNKWYSLEKFDFSNMKKKNGTEEVYYSKLYR